MNARPVARALRLTGLLSLALLGACGGDSAAPEPSGPAYAQVAAGYYHSCGLALDGALYCWGDAAAGQIGTSAMDACDDISDGPNCALRPRRAEMDGALSLTAGGAHSCALDANGAAYCWGSNEYGQLGTGSTSVTCGAQRRPCAQRPTRVVALPYRSISAGGSHTCAVTPAGEAQCWGYGAHGRLGTGASAHEATPVPVAGEIRFRVVDAGGSFTCGIALDDRAYCWGYNHLGQLGDGTTTLRDVPTPVATPLRFDTIAVGVASACALTRTGAAYCWGGNADGALGTGAPAHNCSGYGCDREPRAVLGGYTFRTITLGAAFACGDTAQGVLCWGDNDERQTGTGRSDVLVKTPTPTARVTLRTVDAGFDHACGVSAAGAAYCWGAGAHGSLGTGQRSGIQATPARVIAP